MKIVNNRYEVLIIIFSLLGILFSLYNISILDSNILTLFNIQLIMFFFFITLYALKLKITIYYCFVFPLYFLYSGNIIFALFLAYYVFTSIPRWENSVSYTNKNKVVVAKSSYEILQRYVLFFMIFIVINLAITYYASGSLATTFDPNTILFSIISVSLLITIYMSFYPLVESLYFYVISVVAQVSFIYINLSINQAITLIFPYVIMLFIIIIYYFLNKKN